MIILAQIFHILSANKSPKSIIQANECLEFFLEGLYLFLELYYALFPISFKFKSLKHILVISYQNIIGFVTVLFIFIFSYFYFISF